MNKDKLEKYISEHRIAFDSERAPEGLWNMIENDLDDSKNKRGRLFSMLSVAASSVLVLCAGLLIGLQLGSQKDDNSPIVEEFVEAENYYNNQLRVKWSEIQNTGIETNNVAEDLKQLDDVYNELKSELLQNPNVNSQIVIDALITNYRTKIDLLETILQRTKEKKLSNINIKENEMDEI